jgi:hypothetical protein
MQVEAAEILLIIFSSFLPIFAIGFSIGFLCYFQNREERWKAWIQKIVIVFSISLAILTIFLIPIDSANTKININKPNGIAAGGLNFPLGIIYQVNYL